MKRAAYSVDDSKEPPSACPICRDDRQFVGWEGQRWTTLEKIRRRRFKNRVKRVRRGLHQIITEPPFAICQRAFLVETGSGNLLWDCITYLDGKTISAIEELGGIDCIAISHPHYYSSIVEWSDTFGGAPVYIHESDRMWVQRKGPKITYWKGEKASPLPGLKIINLGGHFDGSSVLCWRPADSRGVLLSGDTIYVVMDAGGRASCTATRTTFRFPPAR